MIPTFGARGDSHHVNEYFYRFWDNVFFPYLKEHGIQNIFHLGDVVDRRKFINFKIADDFRTRFLDRLEFDKLSMSILVGNHDVYYRNTNAVNAIDNLCHGRNDIKIYTGPDEVEIDGLKVLLLPWITAENYADSLQAIKNTDAQVIFGHLEIAGFEMDRGNVCHEGMNRNLFDRFDMVLSGHFHHKSTDGTIFYLGNQYEITWADYNDPRGFHVFDTETRKIEFIRNPYRLFYKIIYDDKDDAMTFDTLKAMDFTEYANTYVKVVVTNKSNPYLFDSFIEELNKCNAIDISVVEDLNGLTDTQDDDTIQEAEDTLTILNKYVDGLSFNVDNGKLKNVLRQIYVEALDIAV